MNRKRNTPTDAHSIIISVLLIVVFVVFMLDVQRTWDACCCAMPNDGEPPTYNGYNGISRKEIGNYISSGRIEPNGVFVLK